LLYTSPDKWHNITEPVAIAEFQKLANRHAFGLTLTEIVSNFNDEYLKKFDVIVFLHSTSRDFSPEQLESFQRYIRNGGGFVGIHGSSAFRKNEGDWYKQLVGRAFKDHPEEQTAVLTVVDKNHPANMHLPDKWIWTDEWYAFSEPLTKNQKILLTVDESTYDPARAWGATDRNTAMGSSHPIAWYQEFDGGRSFYTSLGHMAELYKDARFIDHIYGGIYWAATGLGLKK
jgi:type 1 glutamine amidotransferase